MDSPILLFDGECNFCRATVHWLVKHDTDATLRYAPLQSDVGRTLLRRHGVDPDGVESIVLIDRDQVHLRSEAAFEALERVDDGWRRLRIARRFPRALRDFVYDRISHNRPLISRLVGTIHHRYEPRGAERERFLAT
ncbi:MAG: thiol-disulfide oxidoreductase DCC family protein [Verrucomicrobiota bacterium]